MGAGYRKRELRARLAALLLVAALSGCASSSSYAGISLRSGAADRDLQELAMRARSGDKHAQLELGIRYEEGRGVAVDRRLAERLYRLAAADTGGVRMAHIPTGKGGRISTVPVSGGPLTAGLTEAKRRLERLAAIEETR